MHGKDVYGNKNEFNEEVIDMAYLFVHFRETYGTEGEQIYFSVSRDGYDWIKLNQGNPVLVADKGDEGVRDITICRTKDNSFVIMATDLALRKHEATKYKGSIKNAFHDGSKCIAMWKSPDLVNWSEEILLDLSDGILGCLWAPGIFFDENTDEYIVHWSSTHIDENYSGLSIYYSITNDFEHFTKPQLFYKKTDSEILDSCICYSNGTYHFFVKSADNPKAVIHETSKALFGPYIRDEEFDRQMDEIPDKRAYEAPTVFVTQDKKTCLLMDYYGYEEKEKQGYVPFLMDSLDNVVLNRADEKFNFPYGFKHGVVLDITEDEFQRILNAYS